MKGQAAVHQEAKFLKASDVANIMQVSTTSAYRIIKRLNAELQNQGKIIIPGKISRRFFEEKVVI